MIDRRLFCVSSIALLASANMSFAEDEEAELDVALEEAKNRQRIEATDELYLGSILPPPSDQSWKDAKRILAGAKAGYPVDVAKYFIDAVPAKYQRAWPEADRNHPTFANPVILAFFFYQDKTGRRHDSLVCSICKLLPA
jgi:hypothetical protein